jgi:hypothetical protein
MTQNSMTKEIRMMRNKRAFLPVYLLGFELYSFLGISGLVIFDKGGVQ